LGDATSEFLLSAFIHAVFVHSGAVLSCVSPGEGSIRLFTFDVVVDAAFKMAMSACRWLSVIGAVDKMSKAVAESMREESLADITVEGALSAIGG
jgi:hypothetical protein